MDKKGNIIAELRKEAGYTQKSLAKALHVTDKAVSKWERGLNMPDVTLLPRLSQLLGADIDLLLSQRKGRWEGLIDLRSCDLDLSSKLPGKPLVYFLLSHFLLLDITKIHFLTTYENQKYLASPLFEAFGFNICYNEVYESNLMILRTPTFLFGADLTRHFQSAMVSGGPVILETSGNHPTFFFCPTELIPLYCKNPEHFYEKADKRTLGRGMIRIDMNSTEGLLDVAWFVHMYEKNSGLQIGDLEEISHRKGYSRAGLG